MNRPQPPAYRKSNIRLGLCLAAIAIAFFCAIIVKKILIG